MYEHGPLYRMDDYTFAQLENWCQRECREDEWATVRDQVVNYLESVSEDDAEYSLNHGWAHILNLITS